MDIGRGFKLAVSDGAARCRTGQAGRRLTSGAAPGSQRQRPRLKRMSEDQVGHRLALQAGLRLSGGPARQSRRSVC